jgi:hypothetical protein
MLVIRISVVDSFAYQQPMQLKYMKTVGSASNTNNLTIRLDLLQFIACTYSTVAVLSLCEVAAVSHIHGKSPSVI